MSIGVWRRGEACLLLGEAEAFEAYEKAWNHQNTVQDKHAREAIRKQAERIIAQQKKLKASEQLGSLHDRLAELLKQRHTNVDGVHDTRRFH